MKHGNTECGSIGTWTTCFHIMCISHEPTWLTVHEMRHRLWEHVPKQSSFLSGHSLAAEPWQYLTPCE